MIKKELKLKIDFPLTESQILFGYDFVLKKLPRILENYDLKIAIITDTNVEKLFVSQFEKLDQKIFSFPAGEHHKTRETKVFLEDALLSNHYSRDSLIVGLGGGIVNDLAGFIASTYCRGIKWIQIPTTLLAMVDASIGGKTGINSKYGKNMIGSFYFPEMVLIDTKFLETLPHKEKINGIVEVIKYGLIKSPKLFQILKENSQKWNENDQHFLKTIIWESVLIKSEVIEKDPFEKMGLRRILNFGHTIGHALEKLEEYQMDHGIAVAIGIMVESFISFQLGFLSHKEFESIYEIFTLYQVPMQLSKYHPFERLLTILSIDKKAKKSVPRITILKSIGQIHSFDGEYCSKVEFDILEKAIAWMHEEFYAKTFHHAQ